MPTATSNDGRITVTTDDDYAGLILQATFDDLDPTPIQVIFERDGVRVRSGDPAWAPGGRAIAYDHEAPLGVFSVWRALPVFQDGAEADWTDVVTITAPTMAAGVDCWVKPLDNPSLAIGLPVHTDRIEVSTEARVALSAVQGRTHPAASWDKRTPVAIPITLRTTTKAEKDQLAAALDFGPVLIQLRDLYGIDDFYALPMGSTQRYFQGMFSATRDNPTGFQPIARTPTLDSPLRVPGHSYAENLDTAATYAISTVLWATYLDALGIGAVPPEELIDESGGEGDEGSP